MKISELVVGRVYAVKAGPSSKECYRAMVLDPKYVGPLYGSNPLKGVAIARLVTPVRAGTALARVKPWLTEGEHQPDLVETAGLIQSTWEDYEQKRAVTRETKHDQLRARREEEDARVNRAIALDARAKALGFKLAVGTEVDEHGRVRISANGLDALLDAFEKGKS